MEQTSSLAITCEACNVRLHPNAYEQHINGKKHKFKQEEYNKKHRTIFITGTSKISPNDLKKVFMKFGQIVKLDKHQVKPFAFIQFADKDSVEKVLKARVFASGKRLFVHRYDNRNRQNCEEENKDKTRKFSETLSLTSQGEEEAAKGPQLGVKELPVEIADPTLCHEDDVVLWQARQFLTQVELSPEQYQSLNEVKLDMENLFRPLVPSCRIVVFGSCGSTLAFKNSDVDLFLQVDDSEQLKDFVRREAKEMYRSRNFKVITRIPSARVPIVKFEHLKTGWQGDLTANSQLGVSNSQLIRFLVSLDPRVKPLVMVIKYWAKVCGLSGSGSRFTTYSLVMLVIFYLQQLDPPMLPTIAQLQQMAIHKQFALGWECSFCDEEWVVESECLPRPNNLSMRQLLTGFFRFYHNFNFNNVACPLLGKCLPVSDFDSDNGSDLPYEMFLYKEKLKTDPKCKFKSNVNFKVQDPFELCLNITRNVSEKTFCAFKEACKVSLELCEKEEDAVLLKSLFSLDKKALDVFDNCLIIYFYFKENSDLSAVSESLFAPWFQLTVDSIVLVLKKIFKINVDPHNEVVSKVKKVESSQDVHTPMNSNNSEKLVFECSGDANVWDARKRMSRFMNCLNFSLDPFEREVCISNALYYPGYKPFHFTLIISSLNESEKGGKGIEVRVVNKSARNPQVKGFMQSLKIDLRVFVVKAQAFIHKVKNSSPLSEVKESMKQLFELKFEYLPDLKKLLKERNEFLTGKSNKVPVDDKKIFTDQEKLQKPSPGKNDNKPKLAEKERVLMSLVEKKCKQEAEAKEQKLANKERLLMKFMDKGEDSDEENSKNDFETTGDELTSNTTILEQKELVGDTRHPEQEVEQIDKKVGELIPQNELMKAVLLLGLPENMPSSKTQMIIDEYFKPPSLDEEPDVNRDSKNSEDTAGKFSDLLNTIKKVETQPKFTADEITNPFYAAIERTARIHEESKTLQQHKTEKHILGSEPQKEGSGEKLNNVIREQGGDNVKECYKQDCKTKNYEGQTEPNVITHKKSKINLKNKSDQDRTFNIRINVPSPSQEASLKNGDKKGAANEWLRKEDDKKVHSERTLKQKKPNTTRVALNALQPWVGGGPPGCQQWKGQSRPQPSTNKKSQSQGNSQWEHRRHYPGDTHIQWQKKWYPGLFRDGNSSESGV